MKKSTILVGVIAVLVVVVGVTAGTYVNNRMMEKVASNMSGEETYSLRFLSGIQYQPNQPSTLEFTVIDKNGKRLSENDYKVTHQKIMHVIVVSNDLANFQHVHPVFDTGSNSYKLPGFIFPAAGEYRIFADFEVAAHGKEMDRANHAGVQYQDVLVGDAASVEHQSLGPDTTTAEANGNQVKLQLDKVTDSHTEAKKRLEFTITENSQKVTNLENYLGALGHLVILRGGDLEYLHTHAINTNVNDQNGTIGFETDFKKPGKYKAFLQFQRDGRVMTVSFVITIK